MALLAASRMGKGTSSSSGGGGSEDYAYMKAIKDRQVDEIRHKIRGIVRSGDVGKFLNVFNEPVYKELSTYSKYLKPFPDDIWGKLPENSMYNIVYSPSLLHLAVLSRNPQMVQNVIDYFPRKNLFHIDSTSAKTQDLVGTVPANPEEENLCMGKTARQIVDILLENASDPAEISKLKQIKSILIQNGAKPKTKFGFTVFPENAKNANIWKSRKMAKGGGSRRRRNIRCKTAKRRN